MARSLSLLLLLLLPAVARADDSVIVKFRAGVSASTKRAALEGAGAGPTLGTVRGQAAKVVAAASPAAVAAELNDRRGVLYAEPNAELHATPFRGRVGSAAAVRAAAPAAPRDPLFASQRDLALMGVPDAWAAAGLGGFPATGGVTVGIVDTGIDAGHEDLAGKVAACGASTDGVVADGTCADDNDHGTHVAGTIAALANNGVGITGVAFASRLAICKALDADGAGDLADVASCIAWVHARGAKVISLSLGGEGSVTLQNAIESVWEGGHRGGSLVVAAAGNDGDSSTEFPAGYPEVVSVAAVDDSGAHASFSNTNDDVELAAPGVDVLSTKRGGGYVRFSGTSMATPHVAGAAALVLGAHKTLSPAGVRSRLDRSVKDAGAPGRDPAYGFGILDAAAAVR